jgi:hypothetical protein
MPRILLKRSVSFTSEDPKVFGLNRFVNVTAGVPTEVPDWVVASEHFKLLGTDAEVLKVPVPAPVVPPKPVVPASVVPPVPPVAPVIK